MQHYWCYKFWLAETQRYKNSKNRQIFPITLYNAYHQQIQRHHINSRRSCVNIYFKLKTANIMNCIPLHYKALEDLVSNCDGVTSTRITEKIFILQRVHINSETPTQSIDAISLLLITHQNSNTHPSI